SANPVSAEKESYARRLCPRPRRGTEQPSRTLARAAARPAGALGRIPLPIRARRRSGERPPGLLGRDRNRRLHDARRRPGPDAAGRTWDLTKAAADQLGLTSAGVDDVRYSVAHAGSDARLP